MVEILRFTQGFCSECNSRVSLYVWKKLNRKSIACSDEDHLLFKEKQNAHQTLQDLKSMKYRSVLLLWRESNGFYIQIGANKLSEINLNVAYIFVQKQTKRSEKLEVYVEMKGYPMQKKIKRKQKCNWSMVVDLFH